MKHRLLPTLFLILLIAPISASAQWTWVHPMPQGNTLRDVVFLTNTTAIAVGDYGTILVTHDTGATWSVAWNVDGVTGTLQAIDRLDDNTAVVVGDGGVMLRTSTQGFWWDVISGLGWPDLVDVSFADATHGIATGGIQGNSVALRTSGGGVNYSWDTVSLGSTVFRNVDMASATDGFAISDVGLLYHTTDGGASWSVATPPASGNTSLYVVDFLDPLHGAVATTLGEDHFFNPAPPTCFVTADGGATWSSSSLNYGLLTQDYFPGEILYPQSGTILVAGKVVCCTTSAFDSPPTGELSLSTDTGASFASAANGRPMYGLARNADGTVITVGEHGRMLRRDSGGTITTIGGPEPSQGYNQFAVGSSSFLNSQVGVAMSSDGLNYVYGEGSYLGATTDGGETWTQVSRPEDCMDVVCLSSTEMLAVGLLYNQGAVLRSTNAGASWSNIWTQSSPSALTAVAAG
ncbi:MAG TPA: YCF48-related protein, partial [Candidatus Krumholzibacteria bacterium]|nr:YCF48-related protein [Candidatus Krumholzibacteria bacterium]